MPRSTTTGRRRLAVRRVARQHQHRVQPHAARVRPAALEALLPGLTISDLIRRQPTLLHLDPEANIKPTLEALAAEAA